MQLFKSFFAKTLVLGCITIAALHMKASARVRLNIKEVVFEKRKNQNQVKKGRVLDAITKNPIPGASVFVNASGIATICDNDGYFSLNKFIESNLNNITIAAVGYQTNTYKINTAKEEVVIFLTHFVKELDPVIVQNTEKNGWQKYGTGFLESFLGYSDIANQCIIENPEVISFYFNKSSQVLTAKAQKPLIIQNKALGYKITYWLDHFEHYYKTRIISFSGSSLFEDKITKNTRKKLKSIYLENRKTAYNGSVLHFIRTVYQNQLETSGFLVRRLQKVETEIKGRYTNVVEPTLLKSSDFIDTISSQKVLSFEHYLYIVYENELEELPYLFKLNPFKKPIPSKQSSIVSLVDVPYVEIFANGHIEPSVAFFLEGYWSYEKLDKLLPLDYQEQQ